MIRRVVLGDGADLDGFRRAVRSLAAAGIPPNEVDWQPGGQGGLFGDEGSTAAPPLSLPRRLGEMIGEVVPHRDPERYALLYDVVWRILGGERQLMEVASDPVIHRLDLMARAVRRDIHKMHAYLRFRKVEDAPMPGPEHYAAWFEPDHFILEAAVPFFVERFRSMVWTIVTPVGCALWDGSELRFGPAGRSRRARTTSWRSAAAVVLSPRRRATSARAARTSSAIATASRSRAAASAASRAEAASTRRPSRASPTARRASTMADSSLASRQTGTLLQAPCARASADRMAATRP